MRVRHKTFSPYLHFFANKARQRPHSIKPYNLNKHDKPSSLRGGLRRALIKRKESFLPDQRYSESSEERRSLVTFCRWRQKVTRPPAPGKKGNTHYSGRNETNVTAAGETKQTSLQRARRNYPIVGETKLRHYNGRNELVPSHSFVMHCYKVLGHSSQNCRTAFCRRPIF